MGKTYGSKKELEKEGSNFKAFKPGSYIVRFTKLEVKDKKNFDGDVVPTLALQFSPYEANARTAVMKDVDGGTIKPLSRKIFLDMNKISMGFYENFTLPAKYRALVAALQGVDPNGEVDGPEELDVESAAEQLEQYLGDYIVMNLTSVEKNDKTRNKITGILEVPEDFEADHVVEAQAEDEEKKRAEKKDGDRPSRKRRAVEEEDEAEEEIEEIDEEDEKPAKKKEKKTRKAIF